MTALKHGQPLLVDEFPISKESTTPTQEGHVVELGVDETVMPARGRIGNPYGFVLEIKDGVAVVGRGGSYLVEAILSPGQKARMGDRLIVDSAGQLRVTNIQNEHPYKPNEGFIHPVVVGIAEQKVQSGDKPERILVRTI